MLKLPTDKPGGMSIIIFMPEKKQIKRKRYVLYNVLIVIQIVFCCVISGVITLFHDNVSAINAAVAVMETLCLILTIPIFISVLRYNTVLRITEVYLMMLIVNSIFLSSDAVFNLVNGKPSFYILNFAVNTIHRVCPVALSLLFWFFMVLWEDRLGVPQKKRSYILHIAAVADLLFMLANIPGRYLFDVSRGTGEFAAGPLLYFAVVFPFISIAVFTTHILCSRQSVINKVILLAYPILPLIIAVIQFIVKGPSLVSVAIFFSLLLFFTNLFVRRGREAISRQRDLTLARLQVLQMQINPHFLYNTLASIGSLCDSDPAGAQEMIYQLSDYLHDNFTDIHTPSMISFSEELDHLKSYISIQKMRFPDIGFEYDLETVDFFIPAMTLQPLVENSIRHGLRKLRDRKGVITVMTKETDAAWTVSVKDNGIGFVPEEAEDTDEHIGLSNVRARLGMLCGGELEVTSVPSEGTVCRILLPKEY